jgi:alpha-methylacyl-CoA racemase
MFTHPAAIKILGVPMTGVKVIEIASLAPAPFGCTILADRGADVLRIDRACGGGLAMPPGAWTEGVEPSLST